MPVLNVIVRLNCFLQIFVSLLISKFLDSIEILSDIQFLGLVYHWAVPIWRLNLKLVDAVLLPQAHLSLLLSVYLTVKEANRRCLVVLSLLEFFLSHGNLQVALSRT